MASSDRVNPVFPVVSSDIWYGKFTSRYAIFKLWDSTQTVFGPKIAILLRKPYIKRIFVYFDRKKLENPISFANFRFFRPNLAQNDGLTELCRVGVLKTCFEKMRTHGRQKQVSKTFGLSPIIHQFGKFLVNPR